MKVVYNTTTVLIRQFKISRGYIQICMPRNLVKKAEVCSSFNTTTVTGTTVREHHPRSHHKSATDRVRTGDRLYPVHLIVNSLYYSAYKI